MSSKIFIYISAHKISSIYEYCTGYIA